VNADRLRGGDRTQDRPAGSARTASRAHHAVATHCAGTMNGSAAWRSIWADQNVRDSGRWYPAKRAGNRVAEAIAGDFSPAGRLPVTFYKSATNCRRSKTTPWPSHLSLLRRRTALSLRLRLSFTSFAYKVCASITPKSRRRTP